MTRRQAVVAMIVATMLWSIAGVVARQLQSAGPIEVTFWRSLFNAVGLAALLGWLQGPRSVAAAIASGGRTLWVSAACWATIFTTFMVAITLTTVANVLITMSLAPLFTALLARFVLGHSLSVRTWLAIAVAAIGICGMYAQQVSSAAGRHLVGTAVALAVPVAYAINWTAIQHTREGASAQDLRPALLIGAVVSALLTLPLSVPFTATLPDLGWLGLLGVVQQAIPCLLAVAAARVLSAPEVALIALAEVIFGVAWAWLGAGEAPSAAVLGGGTLVLGALVMNETLALRDRRSLVHGGGS